MSSKVLQVRHYCLSFLLLVTFGLVACNSGQHINAAGASAEQTWSIELQISGGFAGIDQRIFLDNTGKLTSINKKTGNQIGARADTRLMAYAANMLKAGQMESTRQPGKKLPFGCADCINYNINIVSHGRQNVVRLNTLSLKTSPYGDLVKRMTVAAQQLNRVNKTH